MKRPYPIKIFFVLLNIGLLSGIALAGTFKIHSRIVAKPQAVQQQKFAIYKLTAQDRKKYLLNIDQQKIGRSHDTIYAKRKYKFFNAPVILSNLSNDTLRYLTMSCSWDIFFSINNQKLTIWSWPCDSNFPVDKVLLPHKSIKYNIPVILKGNYIKGDKFRIGMNLFVDNKQNRRYLFELIPNFDRTINLIWTNEIKIP